jgi:hypothetical protein
VLKKIRRMLAMQALLLGVGLWFGITLARPARRSH